MVAPYDALVVERDVGVGQFVTSGSRVATLNNIEVAEVHVPIAGFDSAFLPESIKELTATVTQQGILS
ncbi:HlyD family secretion protein, partial [Escherichia coli]|nr:HlyD family secretion protein [Escherichia coli]